jgi:hypothetical protein
LWLAARDTLPWSLRRARGEGPRSRTVDGTMPAKKTKGKAFRTNAARTARGSSPRVVALAVGAAHKLKKNRFHKHGPTGHESEQLHRGLEDLELHLPDFEADDVYATAAAAAGGDEVENAGMMPSPLAHEDELNPDLMRQCSKRAQAAAGVSLEAAARAVQFGVRLLRRRAEQAGCTVAQLEDGLLPIGVAQLTNLEILERTATWPPHDPSEGPDGLEYTESTLLQFLPPVSDSNPFLKTQRFCARCRHVSVQLCPTLHSLACTVDFSFCRRWLRHHRSVPCTVDFSFCRRWLRHHRSVPASSSLPVPASMMPPRPRTVRGSCRIRPRRSSR